MITASSGHYGPGTGAQGLIDEVTEAIKVTKEVVRILRTANIQANYIEDNVNKSQSKNIPWLIAQHNKTSRLIDVSVHFNASAGTHERGIGTETLIYSGKNIDTAEAITNAIVKVSGLKDRGVKIRKDLGILKGTNKPCYLIEVCFVNSKTDVELYRKNFDAICHAIATELAKAVGKSLKPSKTVQAAEDKKEVVDMNYKKDEKPSKWAEEAVNWAKQHNVSDGTFLKRPATREEMIVMLHRMNVNVK